MKDSGGERGDGEVRKRARRPLPCGGRMPPCMRKTEAFSVSCKLGIISEGCVLVGGLSNCRRDLRYMKAMYGCGFDQASVVVSMGYRKTLH